MVSRGQLTACSSQTYVVSTLSGRTVQAENCRRAAVPRRAWFAAGALRRNERSNDSV